MIILIIPVSSDLVFYILNKKKCKCPEKSLYAVSSLLSAGIIYRSLIELSALKASSILCEEGLFRTTLHTLTLRTTITVKQ